MMRDSESLFVEKVQFVTVVGGDVEPLPPTKEQQVRSQKYALVVARVSPTRRRM